jgi:hypothetical protein
MQDRELMKRAHVAAPCPVKWEDMQGDDKSRFCGQCQLNVFKASAMTDEEVLHAISLAAAGQRVCMQLYRRADGTFLTKNCPVCLQTLRERARNAAAWHTRRGSLAHSTRKEYPQAIAASEAQLRILDALHMQAEKDGNVPYATSYLSDAAGMRQGSFVPVS